jgi:hypothetical protein
MTDSQYPTSEGPSLSITTRFGRVWLGIFGRVGDKAGLKKAVTPKRGSPFEICRSGIHPAHNKVILKRVPVEVLQLLEWSIPHW